MECWSVGNATTSKNAGADSDLSKTPSSEEVNSQVIEGNQLSCELESIRSKRKVRKLDQQARWSRILISISTESIGVLPTGFVLLLLYASFFLRIPFYISKWLPYYVECGQLHWVPGVWLFWILWFFGYVKYSSSRLALIILFRIYWPVFGSLF